MSEIRKIKQYDEFRCIAGQCGFTCCVGWDIMVDADTCDKWNKHDQAGYFTTQLKQKKQDREQNDSINLGQDKRCPFLDDQGLCNIVSSYGEEYLPNTCQSFPRLENHFGELSELSLSCACPVVVEMLGQIDGYLSVLPAVEEDIAFLPLGYRLRNALLAILEERTYSFKDRILLGFQLLMDIKDEAGMVDSPHWKQREEAEVESSLQIMADAELIEENILKYKDPEYKGSLIDIWNGIEVGPADSWLEVNELFLDICKNYHLELQYQKYLKDIYEFAEILDTEEDTEPFERFPAAFREFNRLIENCFTAKIYASCISDDIDEMLLTYQMLVTEYVMIRYSSFLRVLMQDKKAKGIGISLSTVQDDIVCFSRIIGYNTDGMKEFWEESFDDAIWELGYLILLVS